MRVTCTLFSHGRVVKIFKDKWKAVSRKRIGVEAVPASLQLMGVQIKEAKEVAEPVVRLPRVEVPEPWKSTRVPAKLNPHWNDRICHMYTNEFRLLEGLPQAQILTNTVVEKGLPPHIEELIGFGEEENQDELVKRIIRQSQVLDGYQVRLPKIIDLSPKRENYSRVYGIPVKRRIETMIRNLLRVMEGQTNSFTGLTQRHNFTDTNVILTTTKNKDLLQLNVAADVLVTSKTPLAPFASPDDVLKLRDAPLPDIYPIKHTIDFYQTNIYQHKEFFPLKNSLDNHIHTLYLCDAQPKFKWSSSQRQAKALIACHTWAVAQARNQYGLETTSLARPIVVQCVQSDGRQFSFVSFQLNTLDIDIRSSERNIAWIQADVPMYDTCEEKNGWMVFDGYNPDVYENLLAMHMNGMTMEVEPSLAEMVQTRSLRLESNVTT